MQKFANVQNRLLNKGSPDFISVESVCCLLCATLTTLVMRNPFNYHMIFVSHDCGKGSLFETIMQQQQQHAPRQSLRHTWVACFALCDLGRAEPREEDAAGNSVLQRITQLPPSIRECCIAVALRHPEWCSGDDYCGCAECSGFRLALSKEPSEIKRLAQVRAEKAAIAARRSEARRAQTHGYSWSARSRVTQSAQECGCCGSMSCGGTCG